MERETSSVESLQALAAANLSEVKKRIKLRRKLRRLATQEDDPSKEENHLKSKFSSLIRPGIKVFLILSLCLLIIHIQSPERTHRICEKFVRSYKNHYYQIFYGSGDYCSQRLTTNLFERLKQQVLNQDQVLKDLEKTLNKGDRITSIAFVGPSGVGKTLLARALQQHFPWPDNVHSYAWNSYVRNEVDRFNLLQLFFDGLSDCGRNLLVIDNLVPSDDKFVNSMQDSLRKSIDKNKNVVVIFIFNLNAMQEDEVYAANHDMLQHLNKTKVLNFRHFEIGDVYECIEHEAKLENMTLKVADFEEILRTIDAKTSGCKNVFAKILMFGKRN